MSVHAGTDVQSSQRFPKYHWLEVLSFPSNLHKLLVLARRPVGVVYALAEPFYTVAVDLDWLCLVLYSMALSQWLKLVLF